MDKQVLADWQTPMRRAMHRWGIHSQRSVLIEECGELIQRAAQLPNKKCTEDQFLEELADVEIMIDQMRLYFGNEGVDKWRVKKLKRLMEITATPGQDHRPFQRAADDKSGGQ